VAPNRGFASRPERLLQILEAHDRSDLGYQFARYTVLETRLGAYNWATSHEQLAFARTMLERYGSSDQQLKERLEQVISAGEESVRRSEAAAVSRENAQEEVLALMRAKRNGEVVPFSPEKITVALQKAFNAVQGATSKELLEQMTAEVVAELQAEFPEQVPSVEHVQDKVEMALMKAGFLEVAKAYIVYRYEHTEIREAVQEEVLEKIEEKKLTVTTTSGRTELYDEAKVREALAPSLEGYESLVNVDEIMSQLKYELYDGIKTADVMRGLTMVVRSMIERDP
uniref:Ribonucleoside-diphosphate reductase large subunit n=1 Tax=Globodera pallida TaxID=36090 RepID=A0A183CSD3_GLOPA